MNTSVLDPVTAPLDITETIEGRTINVHVENNKVVSATFDGASAEKDKAVLASVCRAMIGFSLREATEHSAFYAARALQADGVLPQGNATGIRLPKSLDEDLGRAERILREIYRNSPFPALENKEWNYEDRGIRSTWRDLTKAEKKARINSCLEQFLVAENLARDTVVRFDIDLHERIDIQISDFVEIKDKPELLMNFERYLRGQTNERLEVFAFEMKDLNRIRRL